MNIPVVYEDDWLVVLNKPSGLLTVPTPKKELRTLTSILNEDFKGDNPSYRLHPCHRLDKETSGLIIYAKGKSTQQKMMDKFKRREIKKKYIAFVQGLIHKRQGEISIPLDGLNAVTRYRVVETRRGFSVVEAQPLTGRKNQLRIHFKQIGHPIVGETRYAFRRDFQLRAKRLCLHAAGLRFEHPVTKRYISLSVDLPQDLKKFLEEHH